MFLNIKITRKTICIGIILFLGLLTLLVSNVLHSEIVATSTKNSSSKANNTTVEVPIIMYHSILKDPAMHGEYVVSPDAFEDDLIFLKENGYNTIVMQDLINYVYEDKELPEKPVILTFDDGFYNNYLYAYPLVIKYNFKMVLSPVVAFTEKYSDSEDFGASYANCRWIDLKEMKKSGYVEIQNHTYDMHSNSGTRLGIKKNTQETVSMYAETITEDLTKAQDAFKYHLKYTPTTFTYPFGAYSKESTDILKKLGFKASLCCEENTNTITKDKNCLYNLGRFLRSNNRSVEFILGE